MIEKSFDSCMTSNSNTVVTAVVEVFFRLAATIAAFRQWTGVAMVSGTAAVTTMVGHHVPRCDF
jgi:hypothetical protein